MTVIFLKTRTFFPDSSESGRGASVFSSGDGRTEKLVKIGFADGSSYIFSTEYLCDKVFFDETSESGSWEAGRELTPFEEEAFSFAALCYKAEKAALRLIARAEQNSRGLTAKLERRGFDSPAVKAVVSRLLDRNLLDDGRFAERWIRFRIAGRKCVSPRWLLISLMRKGAEKSSSREALEKVLDPETEYTLLLGYLEKLEKKYSKRAGTLRAHLKYEGFSSVTLDRYFETQ